MSQCWGEAAGSERKSDARMEKDTRKSLVKKFWEEGPEPGIDERNKSETSGSRRGLEVEGEAWSSSASTLPLIPRPPTESLRSRLLASPTALRALSTSRWPGRQLTQRFSAWVTALAT